MTLIAGPRRCGSGCCLSLTRGWVSVGGYEEFFAALADLATASDADSTSGAALRLGGPVDFFWRDFWREAPDRSLARQVTD
jgi:hypothetical protein